MNRNAYQKSIDNKHNGFAPVSMKDIVTVEYPQDPLELLGEKSFNEPREIDESEIGSPVQEFFRDAVVFLTGGTGFMGKAIVEKLLRSCPHIKHIYLLIRSKKGKSAEQRLNEIFTDRLYTRLKHEVPKYYLKISAMDGDCSLPDLGLSNNNINVLINEVNIIFHGAATVRFNEHIRVAMNINVSGTREVLKLARKITNLKVMAHISTAFSNCNHLYVEEKFYSPPADYEDIFKLISSKDDKTLQDMTKKITGALPNTYSFTKALGEDVIRREALGLPVLVFRPTVVIATYREPVRCWIDNVYGPTGILVGAGTGILHTYFLDVDIVPDLIPVDIAINALICASKETAINKKCEEIPIYTCSSSRQKPLTWSEFITKNKNYGLKWPPIRFVWYYSFMPTTSPYLYALFNFCLHYIIGYIFDTSAAFFGQKPMLLKIYKKIDEAQDYLMLFANTQWTFVNDNLLALWDSIDDQDKQLFNFDINQLSWDYFFKAHCLGLRVYLLKDDIYSLPAARKKWKRYQIMHNVIKLSFYALLIYCAWKIIYLLLSVTGFV